MALGLALESTAGTALEAYKLPEGMSAAMTAPYVKSAFVEHAVAEEKDGET